MFSSKAEKRRTLAALCLCFFSVALDNSKLVAAAPVLGRLLGADSALLEWIVEASIVVYASLLILGGALAERFGPRTMLLSGISVFAGGSVLSAACPPGPALIAARCVLGAGGALMTPATLAALKHMFDESERARAISVWTASYGIGASLGPVVGGALLGQWGLGPAMLANVPALILAFVGVYRLIPASLPRRDVPLDLLGTALGLFGSTALLMAILHGPSLGLRHPAVLAAISIAAVFFASLVAWERRARHPILDPVLFRRARFTFTLLVILFSYLALAGAAFIVAQYWQVARAYGALESGFLSMPLTVSMLTGTLLAPRVIHRFGAERILVASLLIATAGACLLAAVSGGSHDVLFALAEVPLGVGCGSAFTNATEIIMGSVPHERAGSAAAVSESAFELGGALGIAVLGTALAAFSAKSGSFAVATSQSLSVGACSIAISVVVAGWLAFQTSLASSGRGAVVGVGSDLERGPDGQVSLGRPGRRQDCGSEGSAGDPT
jgi:MFS family permease